MVIDEIANIPVQINADDEDTGARRLESVMKNLLNEVE